MSQTVATVAGSLCAAGLVGLATDRLILATHARKKADGTKRARKAGVEENVTGATMVTSLLVTGAVSALMAKDSAATSNDVRSLSFVGVAVLVAVPISMMYSGLSLLWGDD